MSARPRWVRAVALLAAASATALAACSDDGSDQPSATDDGSTQTRSVEHARGVSEVPVAPQRVVVLEPVQLDTAVALDTIPVGTTVLSEATGVPAYLGEQAAGIEMVGAVPEPELEEIAALRPDLIVGTEARHSALYDQLSDIASTVFMESQADPWPDNVRLVADALNKAEEAETLLADYQKRCAEIAAEFDTAGRTAQLIRPRDGMLTLYGPTSFAGSALECVGFTTPERDWENSISVDVSPELALTARADYVLVTTVDPADTDSLPDVIKSNASAFPNLHLVDQSFWITGVGPLGGQTVLDDLERILSESGA